MRRVNTWVDFENGLVDRRIFSDPDIYRLEMEHIFGRVWNFVCHESQIPTPGDFFMSMIGDEEVIVVRGRDQAINVLLNSCPHRGNTVCRAELGHAHSFLCSYHGWNFDLDGRLVAVPGEARYYRDQLDKAEWGLSTAAQVSSYRGFVFATLDPDTPPLEDYLGWVGRLGIDFMAERGKLVAVDGVQKNRVQCNWKLAVDNLFDWYHPKVSHGSSVRINFLTDESLSADQQMVMLGDYGHAIGGPYVTAEQLDDLAERLQGGPEGVGEQWYDMQARWRTLGKTAKVLGPLGYRSLGHPNLFPNLWVALTSQVCLRVPRGPHETELWWFTLLPESLTPEQRRAAMYSANHVFGPAGFLEQDDGENWSHSTRGAQGSHLRARPLHFAMGAGQDNVRTDPSGQAAIETVVNEHGQRWTYQAWQDYMQADDWDALEAARARTPAGSV